MRPSRVPVVSALVLCAIGTSCHGGFTRPDADTDTDEPAGCQEGELACGGACVDPLTDREHCGGCGNACDDTTRCEAGECACPADPPGLALCAGVCVNTLTSHGNCGGCGTPCTADQLCDGTGACATECAGAFERCESTGAGPYCADLATDPLNCGACYARCEGGDHALPSCSSGECRLSCDTGWVDRNGEPSDGCECRLDAAEVCDGADNDCDGDVDEGFECAGGETEACTVGPACTGTRTCDAATCTWGACTNAAWACATPGSSQGCGRCGTQYCTDACAWGPCTDEGECAPGETGQQACADCFVQERICNGDCTWGAWGQCSGESACDPGTMRSDDCGNCGTWSATCLDDCTWGAWGECNGQGECAPTTTQGCARCGTQSCNSGCSWGECNGQGECEAGDTQACGQCGTMTCSASCSWGSCSGEGECTPDATQGCGECGTQTCTSGCAWGTCDDGGGDYAECTTNADCCSGYCCDCEYYVGYDFKVCKPPPISCKNACLVEVFPRALPGKLRRRAHDAAPGLLEPARIFRKNLPVSLAAVGK